MSEKFLSYLPLILGALVAAAAAFSDTASAWVAAHPVVSMVLSAAATIIAGFLKSPAAK